MAEKKSLVKNSIFNMIYKGFTALFPLITTSYISRVLLPAGVGRVWGQAQNYDICLNSGALGVDTCTDMIVQLCK